MLLIRPQQTGYSACTPYGDVVLQSGDHQELFDFVEADLAPFQQAFTSFFESRIDKATAECIGEGIQSAMADGLQERAREMHPLLGNDSYLDSLSTMLLDYLNALLIHRRIELTREQYRKAATHLTDPIFHHGIARGRIKPREELLEAQYRIYEKRDTKALIGGHVHLVRLQKQLRLWLYWILDASASRFSKMTIDERCRLYRRVFNPGGISSDLVFTEHFSWSRPRRGILSLGTYVQRPGDILSWQEESEEKKEFAQAFRELDGDAIELDGELDRYLKGEIEKAEASDEVALFSEYEVHDFAHLLALEVRLMAGESTSVKRCRHCGRYFLAEKSTIEYCSRTAVGESAPCDVIGPRQSFSRLMEEDAALKAYNAAYKTFYARQRRGTMSEAGFSAWRDEAKRRLQEVREGDCPLEEYTAWLKQDVRKWTAN
ncbi:MAG: DUF6076 domain-containing protein [Sphaerochaeta sp.]|uniref:DUF6076 domain-containing protein n=1 Tax=Sphaerochaeta sp. TaxID=1972642 RepID=UPI003D0D4856